MTTPVNAVPSADPSNSQQRGIASLTWGNHVFRFRTNPNEVRWNYSLITKTDQTYGGRVVQILGSKIDDLTVKIDCGNGGWPYLVSVVTYMRDLMIAQRNGQPAVFEYTTRGWKLKVYAANFPFGDQVTATTRELTLNFKVQEDISGIVSSSSIATALQTFVNGIGWQRNQYNDMFYAPNSDTGMIPNGQSFAGGPLPLSVAGGESGVADAITSLIPNANLFTIPGQ
jgi:hypothetical protein